MKRFYFWEIKLFCYKYDLKPFFIDWINNFQFVNGFWCWKLWYGTSLKLLTKNKLKIHVLQFTLVLEWWIRIFIGQKWFWTIFWFIHALDRDVCSEFFHKKCTHCPLFSTWGPRYIIHVHQHIVPCIVQFFYRKYEITSINGCEMFPSQTLCIFYVPKKSDENRKTKHIAHR